MNNMEIERKFILNVLPNIIYKESQVITQGYLAIDEVGEVRVRSINDKSFKMTYKSNGDMIRDEIEFEITPDLFKNLINNCEGRTLTKLRHKGKLPRDPKFFDISIDIDVYTGKHHGLIIGEVEFVTTEEAKEFNPLKYEWIEREVTNDSSFKNRNLI